NNINHVVEILSNSPLRQYLEGNESRTLFEEERKVLNKIDDIIRTNIANLQNPLKAVVLGEVKAGKSTLINSLIQKEVAYTNVVEATAAIVEVKYNKTENIFIKFKNDEKRKINSLVELNKLMDEKRNNQEFFSKIELISISTNTERLKKITIVDTPGLNTITAENTERTEDYIKNADVVLWVINAHNLGQSDVIDKLEEIMEYGKTIIGIVNRIDEIDGDEDEILEYVQEEMGYIFDEIFTTSAKKAWDGFIQNDNRKIEESNINNLYKFIIDNIESNSEEFQMESVEKSTISQLDKDLYVHKNTKNKLDTMLNKIDEDLKSLNAFNNNLKQITENKMNDWLNGEFFKDEKNILLTCDNKDEYSKILKQYTGSQYIEQIINTQYNKMGKYIMDEWQKRSQQFIERKIDNVDFSISADIPENTNALQLTSDDEILDGAKNGGIAAGAVGLGLAGYAAWLGPAAYYVTIGSAVGVFLPPLLIAGAIGGAVLSYLKRDKQRAKHYSQVEVLVKAIKNIVRDDILPDMIDKLNECSDYYYECTSGIISDILSQCNISKEEVEDINNDLSKYIKNLEIEVIDFK
ncbi:MAG: putative GTPase (Dynamin-related) protein, partial [Negativicoccus succinicivorans DORA_17_25]